MGRFAILATLLGACSYSSPDEGELPQVSFEKGVTGADEASATVAIPIVLSRASQVEVTVHLSANGGTATANTDYKINEATLTFPPGETRGTAPVSILPDSDEVEPNETIELVLSDPQNATIGDGTHEIEISNVILPRVTFTGPSSTTPESSPSMLELMLDKPSPQDAIVQLTISGTATPSTDYTIASGPITIPANTTSVVVPIGEINDLLDEDDETVVFELTGPSANLLLGSDVMSTHTISDDDAAPMVQLSEPTRAVMENVGTIQLTVSLSAPSGRTVTVPFSRDSNDSALDNDATVMGSPGTLTFAPGETTKTIDVAISNDNRDENDEDVIVRLGTPTNATIGNAAETITIQDDDNPPSVQFQSSSSFAFENDFVTFRQITLTLSAASGKQIQVPFSATGTCNDCALLTGSPITFDPDDTQKSITIDWSNDGNKEADETVRLQLNTPTNATLGSPNVHTFTLFDND